MTDPLYDITGIKLAEVEKPAQKGRDPLPNPLLDLVKTRKVGDKAARFSIPFGSLDIAEKRRKAILRDLTRSGQELGASRSNRDRWTPTRPRSGNDCHQLLEI